VEQLVEESVVPDGVKRLAEIKKTATVCWPLMKPVEIAVVSSARLLRVEWPSGKPIV